MEQHLKLTKNNDNPEVDASQYRSNPRQSHMNAAMRVLRYLNSTPGKGLLLPSSGILTLEAYCDVSWMSCPSTRRSCIGYYISVGGAPISWRTKKQNVVSRSSAESEYRAMATTVYEIHG
ncbi:secreted RxLR effector protein 161-like [Lactuca sativa]|uniref:secreted RxLR effector protein 161-like n=1 Tax=Lactuca sativa TaxID=4236 RepID=UPI000CD9AE25|nr:secreted RxLR effector protein 161-like [Lactuca sativa]